MGLSVREVQRVLTVAGLYDGGLDGDAGPLTRAAVDRLLSAHADRLAEPLPTARRRRIAAAQLVLADLGFDPGVIDGHDGHHTQEAFNAWAYAQEHGHREPTGLEPDPPEPAARPAGVSARWPRERDAEAVFGPPGVSRQTLVDLPYPMRLAWAPHQVVHRLRCHEAVALPLREIFVRTLEHYGPEGVRELGLDLLGGCFNKRRKRGGSTWSTHAWGIAVDIDPAHNALKWGRTRARLARPECDPFWNIVESAGAVSLGRERDRDWMHFQFARL